MLRHLELMRIRATLKFALHPDKLEQELTVLYNLPCCVYAQRHFELAIYHHMWAHKRGISNWRSRISCHVNNDHVLFVLQTLTSSFPCRHWTRFLCGWKDTILYLSLITVFLYFCSKILVSVVCALLSTQQALLHSSPYLFCFAVRSLHVWDFAWCCYAAMHTNFLRRWILFRLPSFSWRLPQSALVN